MRTIMVPDHQIYSDFRNEVRQLQKTHSRELASFPKEISAIACYYLRKRLLILNDKDIEFDGRLGRPVPYLAFWFADAFGLKDKQIIRQLAASLMYISLWISIRDDLQDGRAAINGKIVCEHAYVCLANIYFSKYINTFREMFPPESRFWYILTNCLDQCWKYESWSFLFSYNNNTDPLSEKFLSKASSYLPAIMLPTLAAIALVTRNHKKIPLVAEFLKHYWMAWKIVDDIRDWQKDLKVRRYNHSSVLYYSLRKAAKPPRLGPEDVISTFSDENSIKKIYNAMLEFYKAARHDAKMLRAVYLSKFMDLQIEFHADERDSLLTSRLEFFRSLENMIKKYMDS
jgi:hypothetical protein